MGREGGHGRRNGPLVESDPHGDVEIRSATKSDYSSIAGVISSGFDDIWSVGAIATLMGTPGTAALVARSVTAKGPILGACLFRVIADEAEVLALAVVPAFRRAGVGARLLDGSVAVCRASGAGAVFLEVAVDNEAAIALYRRGGFVEVGRRPGYYRTAGRAVDALILRSST